MHEKTKKKKNTGNTWTTWQFCCLHFKSYDHRSRDPNTTFDHVKFSSNFQCVFDKSHTYIKSIINTYLAHAHDFASSFTFGTVGLRTTNTFGSSIKRFARLSRKIRKFTIVCSAQKKTHFIHRGNGTFYCFCTFVLINFAQWAYITFSCRLLFRSLPDGLGNNW